VSGIKSEPKLNCGGGGQDVSTLIQPQFCSPLDHIAVYIVAFEAGMSFYDVFSGPGKQSNVNLSTSSTSSSSALLSNVRAERLAREAARRHTLAASKIQKRWRKHASSVAAREELLSSLESGGYIELRKKTAALVVLLKGGLGQGAYTTMLGRVLENWCTEGSQTDSGRYTINVMLAALSDLSYGYSCVFGPLVEFR
jgi:hypothetical protein